MPSQRDDTRSVAVRRLGHECEVADQLAAAAEIPGQRDAPQLRVRDAEVGRGGPKQLMGVMNEALTLRAAQEFDPLQHLRLQRCAEALARFEMALSAPARAAASGRRW